MPYLCHPVALLHAVAVDADIPSCRSLSAKRALSLQGYFAERDILYDR